MSTSQVRSGGLVAAVAFGALASTGSITRATGMTGVLAGLVVAVVAELARRPGSRSPARAAVIALVAHALLELWMVLSANFETTEVLVASLGIDLVLRVAVLATLCAVALELERPVALAGVAVFALGWVVNAALLAWVVCFLLDVRVLGASPEVGPAGAIAIASGGLLIGHTAAVRIADPRQRTQAWWVLTGYVLIGLAAVADSNRQLGYAAGSVTSLLLAVVLRLYERGKPGDPVPRATVLT
jgi:hypothetical protein